ncbi:hypothetical protein P691DRAFT_758075 [Macrolepiota fuliginosa MF-IS2]|uniref:Methyltransferase domain-containing protein n=1 Tax=Macrolepiota fuliginosa MF-IS2 TaxID=1400762 RepID=A0A9P5XHT0_9AGAR|nr:hypothetical protein P691DRAFT_758075 [Macrolepiota fuliginosa MF-IS2]
MVSQPLPPDTEPAFQRSTSTPGPPQVPFKDTSTAHRISSTGVPPLKKRPSALQNPLIPTPPSLPSPVFQSRPGQSPRTGSTMLDSPPPLPRKSSSRPSTANSREDVTPWEFQSGPLPVVSSPVEFEKALTPTQKNRPSSRPPSVKSVHPPSLRSRSSSTAIGQVEEVTPWELYPPIPEKNTKYHLPTEPIPEQTSPTASLSPVTTTGYVEDVTPWELVPPPHENLRISISPMSRAPSQLTSVDETSTLLSYDSAVPHHNGSLHSPAAPSIQHSHVSGTSSQEKAHKTGPTEDVTPWELEPGPGFDPVPEDGEETSQLTSNRLRSSLTLAQVEEVTPWELHPAPSTPLPTETTMAERDGAKVNGVSTIKKKSSRSSNPFSSGSGKSLSDLAFARGRRHGGKSSKSRHPSGSLPSSKHRPHSPVQHVLAESDDQINGVNDETPRHINSRIPESSPTPRFSIKASTAFSGAIPSLVVPVAPTVIIPAKPEPPAKSQNNFSTVDRTILRQLRYFKEAHDQAFKIKGQGHHQLGGGVTPGKIHHAYDEKIAPYPRCYDPRAQDLDVWEIILCRQICNSWTWHVFETAPKAVLDIGCGTGVWIAHVANVWKECHFWGIDLVPTQPDFNTLGDRDMKERVHWVHDNFLDGLPFEDEQFDYIHIKRVGLGVPENKWDKLFEECKRLIEEDLFFPGKPNDANELSMDTIAALETDLGLSSQSSTISNDSSTMQSVPSSVSVDIYDPTATYGGPNDSPATPTTNRTSLLPSSSESSAPALEPTKHVAFTNGGHSHNRTGQPPSPQAASNPEQPTYVPFILPHSRSSARPTLSVKTPSSPQANATFASSAVSLLNAFGHHTPSSTEEYAGGAPRRRSSGMVASPNDAHPHGLRSRTSSQGLKSQHSVESIPASKRATKQEPYLLRTYKAPRNPRDHTMLEAIYSEMLSSKFINITPLSILQNYLEYHFTDVRTHPPLLFTFPPTALLHSESRYVTESETSSSSSDEFSSDDEEARDAIRPKPPKSKIPKNMPRPAELPRSRYRSTLGNPEEDNPEVLRFLSFSQLVHRQSPYVTLDGSRAYAFSPVSQAHRRSTDSKLFGPIRMSRLPNATLNIDLKSLNMHLYLRTMDVLGCSEPMWDWVEQYQEEIAKRRSTNGTQPYTHTPGGAIRPMQSETSLHSSTSADSTDSVMNGIAEMTRDDFEMLLSNFELDMQDQASVDYALQQQANWRVFSSPRDLRRKAFDDSCKKWDKWVMKQERRAQYLAQHRHHHPKNGDGNNNQGADGSHPASDEPQRKYSNGDLLSAPSPTQNGNGNGFSNLNGKQSSSKRDLSPPSLIPFSPSSLPPHKRLSRAIRVYVAWKPQDPNSPNQAVKTHNGLQPSDTPSPTSG